MTHACRTRFVFICHVFRLPNHEVTLVPTFISSPSRIPAPGNKIIQEFVGRKNSGSAAVSIARMQSPAGWEEPSQTPDFDEFTIVLRGTVVVEHDGKTTEVREGQAIVTHRGEKVRYSTPLEGGAEYIAICIPAFSPDIAHRDE